MSLRGSAEDWILNLNQGGKIVEACGEPRLWFGIGPDFDAGDGCFMSQPCFAFLLLSLHFCSFFLLALDSPTPPSPPPLSHLFLLQLSSFCSSSSLPSEIQSSPLWGPPGRPLPLRVTGWGTFSQHGPVSLPSYRATGISSRCFLGRLLCTALCAQSARVPTPLSCGYALMYAGLPTSATSWPREGGGKPPPLLLFFSAFSVKLLADYTLCYVETPSRPGYVHGAPDGSCISEIMIGS